MVSFTTETLEVHDPNPKSFNDMVTKCFDGGPLIALRHSRTAAMSNLAARVYAHHWHGMGRDGGMQVFCFRRSTVSSAASSHMHLASVALRTGTKGGLLGEPKFCGARTRLVKVNLVYVMTG